MKAKITHFIAQYTITWHLIILFLLCDITILIYQIIILCFIQYIQYCVVFSLDSAAQKAGLKQDDCIVRVNGQNVTEMTADHVARVIKYGLYKSTF